MPSIVAVALFLTFLFTVGAQSGRRGNKSTTITPAPTPVAAETPAPSPKPPKPRLGLSIAVDDLDAFSKIPLSSQSAVLQGCVSRLNESASVEVIGVNQNIHRGDASKKAKTGEIHVVFLKVDVEKLSAEANAFPDIRDVFVEFTIYAPTTAKVVGIGRTYPYKGNRTIVPNSRTGGLYGDALYLEAGRDAAEKILAKLHLPTRPVVVR